MRFLLIFLLAGAASATETVVHNVTAYTLTDEGVVEFSVLVIDDDGRVEATGGDELLARFPDARRYDGRGRYVLPGLSDAHAHVYSQGLLLSELNLFGSPSVEHARQAVADYAAEHPHRDWLTGRGWNQVLWPGNEFPTAADLDAVVADRPVWLRRVDGHAGWANSAALRAAGIDDDTPDPVGGRIVRDEKGGATGILVDSAMHLVAEQMPPPTRQEIRKAIAAAQEELLSLGLTAVHDAGIDIDQAEVYLSLADDDELQLRVYAMLEGAGANLDAFGEPVVAYGNGRLDIRAVKLYADGALGSRGAALLAPYSDDSENHGLPRMNGSELTDAVVKANSLGFQVAVHAIGDRGNRMTLDALQAAQNDRPSSLRNRIEHAQIVALEDIPRFAGLGVIASMQPSHATSDMNMAEDRLGPERIKGGYAWRRFLEAGVLLASGSDFPVELANPFFGLYAAVSRQDREGLPRDGWYPDQALTREEALRSFTLDAAFAAHREHDTGSLEPGKWADLIIVDRDYFGTPVDRIDDIEVQETWIAGRRVYRRQGE